MGQKQTITACVFLHKDGKVLVGKRADTKKFLPGKYELPGGHIEFGETVGEGLKRELMEEFKVDIEVENLFYEFTYVDGDEHVIEVEYFAHLKNPNQKFILNDDDHSEVRWISEEEVDQFFKDNDDEGKAVKAGFKALKL